MTTTETANHAYPTSSTFDRLMRSIDPEIAAILDRSLSDHDPSVEDAVKLFDCNGLEMNMLILVADELRRRIIGDTVTYVVNRNINFTNVCIKRCGFCAFSRGHREEEGYYLPINEVVRRAKEAYELGATEVCIQAGLPPKMGGDLYVKICRAIKQEVPQIHIHGFSPEEVIYGAVRLKVSIRDYLEQLKEAGVGSLPGTSAEILDDEVRQNIPRKNNNKTMDRSYHHSPPPKHSDNIHNHVRPHRDLTSQSQTLSTPPANSEADSRDNRIRTLEFHVLGSPDVQEKSC